MIDLFSDSENTNNQTTHNFDATDEEPALFEDEPDPWKIFEEPETNELFNENQPLIEEAPLNLFNDEPDDLFAHDSNRKQEQVPNLLNHTEISETMNTGPEKHYEYASMEKPEIKMYKLASCPSEENSAKTQQTLSKHFNNFNYSPQNVSPSFSSKDLLQLKRQYYSNFDYKAYIDDYLKNIGNAYWIFKCEDTSGMDRTSKKKLIQKVRNRMSAQRSRMRKGIHYQIVENENKYLKKRIEEFEIERQRLAHQNQRLSRENLILGETVRKLESSGCPKW